MGTCNICGQYCNMLSNYECHECRRAAHFNKLNEKVIEVTREVDPVIFDKIDHWINKKLNHHMGCSLICPELYELKKNIKTWINEQ
jgi:hypothetical protein